MLVILSMDFQKAYWEVLPMFPAILFALILVKRSRKYTVNLARYFSASFFTYMTTFLTFGLLGNANGDFLFALMMNLAFATLLSLALALLIETFRVLKAKART